MPPPGCRSVWFWVAGRARPCSHPGPVEVVTTDLSHSAGAIRIRDAQVLDAPAMGELMVTTWLRAHRTHIPPAAWNRRQASWTPADSAAGWERHLRARDADPGGAQACYLVAEDPAGSLIAVAAAAVAANDSTGITAEVGSLYVDPDHQRHGLGRQLLQQLATRLHAIGVQTLHVGVVATNVEAQRFYEALGGHPAGQRLFDEDGDLLPELIYAWPDLTTLLPQP